MTRHEGQDGNRTCHDREEGADRIRGEPGTYLARYRDGDGMIVKVTTECRDRAEAQNVLADLERKAEGVRSGLLTPAEGGPAERLGTPISEHFEAYLDALAVAGPVEKCTGGTSREA